MQEHKKSMNSAASIAATIASLPTPSPVLNRISQVIANPEASATDVAEALKLDPSIATRTLRLANSAYIGMPRTVSSLQNAVVLLGIKSIRSLIVTSELLKPLQLSPAVPFTLERFWRHSTMVGIVSGSIARHLKRYDSIDEDEAFAAGILHDMGKLVLGSVDELRMKNVCRRALDSRQPFHCAEEPEYSHGAIGAAVAEHWNFPSQLRLSLSAHHSPLAQAADVSRLVNIVHVADIMVHVLGFAVCEQEIAPSVNETALSSINLPLERLRVIAQDSLEDQKRNESLIESFRPA